MEGQFYLVFKWLIRWGFLPLLWPMYQCHVILNIHSNFSKDQAQNSLMDHRKAPQRKKGYGSRRYTQKQGNQSSVRLLLWPWVSHLTLANSSLRHSGGKKRGLELDLSAQAVYNFDISVQVSNDTSRYWSMWG